MSSPRTPQRHVFTHLENMTAKEMQLLRQFLEIDGRAVVRPGDYSCTINGCEHVFVLKHTFLYQKNKNYFWVKGLDISNIAFRVEGKLKKTDDNGLIYVENLNKSYIGKRKPLISEEESKTSLSRIHLHANPVISSGEEEMMVMWKMPGSDLDLAVRMKGDLSIRQKIEISLQVAWAVQEQVHDAETQKVHQDIKPGNIMLDNQALECNVIDFGEGLTPEYASPEQLRNNKFLDEKTDVYSTWLAIWETIWNGPNVQKNLINKELQEKRVTAERAVEMRMKVAQQCIDNKLNDKDHLKGEIWNIPEEIVEIYNAVITDDPKQRPSMMDVIERLEAFKLQEKIKAIEIRFRYPVATKEEVNAYKREITKAYNAAKEARDSLRKNAELNINNKKLDKEVILEAMEKIHPVALSEFISTLRIKALTYLTNKTQIKNKLQEIGTSLEHNINALLEMREKLVEYYHIPVAPRLYKLCKEVYELMEQVDAVLDKNYKYKSNIDETVILNQKFKKGIEKLTPKFEKISRQFENQSSLLRLRENLLKGLEEYVTERGKVSTRRQRDVVDIANVLKDFSITTSDELIQKVEKKLKNLKKGWFGLRETSFFPAVGSSRLVNILRSIMISPHENGHTTKRPLVSTP
ncbi:MAG: hypothetical protein EPO11_03065 [Gammaproteobacteria bacterium]|nr:MAG: hypothetical protein EPO11_03065 [Gammaproteobacteria bacterium]